MKTKAEIVQHQNKAPVNPLRIGLALGSGAARGWAHIGVIRPLADIGIVPEVVAGSSINIMQDRITRSRMAGDPPEVILSPHLSHLGLLEFDEAATAIAEGRASVERMRQVLDELQDTI